MNIILFITLGVLSSLSTSFHLIGPLKYASKNAFQMMAVVTPSLVKELRDKSGAGMLDCRNALAASDGNLEGAVDWLRKKGLSAVAKKSGRVTSSGLVGVSISSDQKSAAVVEINCETDFVARNDNFQALVTSVAGLAASKECDLSSLLTSSLGSRTVQEELTNAVATIGENMNIRRLERLSVNNGQVVTYMHNPTKPNLGKIGVVVALESPAGASDGLGELGKKLALHIAASSPEALTVADVAPEKLERERSVLIEQARATGKPEAAIEKMIEGRIRKYYEEVVFTEQPFVMDGKVKVSQLIKDTAKTLGTTIEVKGYARIALGDGIEKKQD